MEMRPSRPPFKTPHNPEFIRTINTIAIMFIRSTLFAFLFASAAAVELRGGARELETQCDCVTSFCQHLSAPVCYGYQTGTSCYAGTVDVCGGSPADPVPQVCDCWSNTPCTHDNDGTCLALNAFGACPAGSTNACGPAKADACECGSPAPCTHNNDGTCLALNALGNCPAGSTSACTCYNTAVNGKQDSGCPSTGTKVCVLNGQEPAPGEGGNECVRCVNTGMSWDSKIAVGCWRNKPKCVDRDDGMLADPGMAGDSCSKTSKGYGPVMVAKAP